MLLYPISYDNIQIDTNSLVRPPVKFTLEQSLCLYLLILFPESLKNRASSPSVSATPMATLQDIISVEEQLISTPYNGLSMTRYLQGISPFFQFSIWLIVTLVAALTCAPYDHALTIGDEINLIWSRKVTPAKILYVAIRYGIEGSLVYVAYSMFFINFVEKIIHHYVMTV